MKAAIEKLVRENPQQMTVAEYSRAADEVVRARPGNLLVFGCGNDAGLWLLANAGGQTLFLESDAGWAAKVQAKWPEAHVLLVSYRTTLAEGRRMLPEARLVMALPRAVRETAWDVVLVDGPAGYHDKCPGRMQSIYEASRLARPGGVVLLHDYHRPVEISFGRAWLGAPKEVVHHLAVHVRPVVGSPA